MTASSRFSTPRAAYVHVPFCRHRCGYCNFTLVAGRDDLIAAYLQAIQQELSWLGEPQQVDTLFLGGGTPTHLSLAELRRLLETVTRWFPLAKPYEFSIEANPIDVDADKIALLAEFGVNRISLGAQSFDDAKLALLERDHRAPHIERATGLARREIASISLDLMFGTPGESRATWAEDLRQALRLPIDHVSTYGLTFERGTSYWARLTRGELSRVAEDDDCWMYETAIDTVASAGFEHYEVSNFARLGHRCRHNEVYWTGGSYFAAGPGAARYVEGRREMNHRSTTTYLQRVLAGLSPVAESESLSAEGVARERLVFGLRRLEGIDRPGFAQQTGFDVDELAAEAIGQFVRQGLLDDDSRRLRLTRAGLLVSDSMWPELLSE